MSVNRVHCSTYLDSEILDVTKIAKMFNEQATASTFLPCSFMVAYFHAKPLLVVLKALKASPIVGTSETERTLESSRVGCDDRQ